MVMISEIKSSPPKILIYGKSGTGKTLFVTSFGKGMQLIDTDRGLRSVVKFQDKWTTSRHAIDVIECLENDPTQALAFNKFKAVIMEIFNACQKKTYLYKILAIDSFTTLADFALRAVQGNSGSKTFTNPSQQQWGLAIGELDNVFMYLKALPIPVVVIFHNREAAEGSGATAITTQEIAIFGKNLPGKIVSYFDEVLWQKMKSISGKPFPYLQTVPDGTGIVRSRDGIPNDFDVNRGFGELMNILGWKGEL